MTITEAIAFAEEVHAGQYRKDGVTEYITHPLRVLDILKQYYPNCTENECIVAVIHDTVEDTHKTLSDIKDIFGLQISLMVDNLTRRTGESKIDYYCRIGRRACYEEKRIKLCDRLANLEDTLKLFTNDSISNENSKFATYYIKDTLNLFEHGHFCFNKLDKEIVDEIFSVISRIYQRIY